MKRIADMIRTLRRLFGHARVPSNRRVRPAGLPCLAQSGLVTADLA